MPGFTRDIAMGMNRAGTVSPSFLLQPGLTSGVANLIGPLTINSVAVDPSFVFVGADAAAGGWSPRTYPASPVTLALQAGTAPTYNQGSPFLGALDDSVLFNSGGHFDLAGLGYLSTLDAAIHVVLDIPAGASPVVMACGATAPFWVMWCNSGGLTISLVRADGTTDPVVAAPATTGTIVDAWVFLDRSGSGQWYVNGAASGVAVDITSCADVGSSGTFAIGAYSSGSLPLNGRVYLAQMYTRAAWLDTHLQAALAKQSFLSLSAALPSVCWGTSTPTAYGSTAAARQRKIVSTASRSFLMGASAPRFNNRNDANGTAFTGALIEGGITQTILQSQTLGTTWSKIDAGDTISDNGANGPDGDAVLEGIAGDTTDGQHGVSQAATVSAVTWVLSTFARVGNKNWLYLADTTVTNCTGYFNLATPVIGTKGAGATAIGVEDWGGGLVRCWMSFLGTAAAHTFQISPADADGDIAVVGDGATVNVYAGCVQLEAGAYPTSYVASTTGTVARAASTLYYDATSVVTAGEGAIRLKFLAPTFTPTRSHYLAGISDGGAAGDRLHIYIDTGGHCNVESAKTGGNAGAASVDTNFCDNTIHEVLCCWRANELNICVDGVWGTVDASVDIPAGIDRIEIGQDHAAANQAGPILVSDVRVYPRFTNRW